MKKERYVIVITPEKSLTLQCDEGDGMSLESLQKLVDGYIEIIPAAMDCSEAEESCDRIVMVINEEGNLMGMPANWAATDMTLMGRNDIIVGNAVLMMAKGEELAGFSEEAAGHIMKKWELKDADQ